MLKYCNVHIAGEVEFITDIKLTNLVASTADGVDIDNLYAVTVLDNKDNVSYVCNGTIVWGGGVACV